jgi:hypothetical protein
MISRLAGSFLSVIACIAPFLVIEEAYAKLRTA